LESFIYQCGAPDPNPHSAIIRDDFETFLKKLVRDSLMFDQACHVAGTQVTLADGTTKSIEDIEVGDIVISHDGNPHKVLHPTQRLFTGNLCTIKSRGVAVTATSNHPLLVLTNKQAHLAQQHVDHKPEWIPAGDVTVDMYLTYPKVKLPTTCHSSFSPFTHDLFDDSYFYIRVDDVTTEAVESHPVYNMEVEDTHSYIANGYVSHNCFEIVPDRKGQPYEFLAIDASTIRLAANNLDMSFSTANRLNNNLYTGISPAANQASPYKTLQVRNPETQDVPSYVQIINGQIRNTYTYNELAWGVRNPRSDIYIQGYGYGELEQLVTTITAHLYAEEYNRRFFMQGSAPKGILNFKGDNLTPDQLEAFRRQWRANLEGTENSWRTPILQTEQGVDWINLHPSNQEMEYGQWMEYLLKLTCAVFLIDPAELNFDMHGGVQQTPLFESSQEWKLKASRDRGLKPMLRFIAKLINNHVVSKIDDHFMFDFMGLDELTEQEKHELRKEQVSTYMTLNEIRRAEDLPDVPDGDIILNPTYTTAQQQRKQLLMQQQQLAASSAAPAAPPPTEEEAPQAQSGNEPSPEKQQNNQGPQYADSFTKSLKVLEINLEDESESWIDIYRGSK
jgi:hypothetical protein